MQCAVRKKTSWSPKKERFLGIWHNGSRVKFKNSYSFYSLFSDQDFDNKDAKHFLSELEIGKNNLQFPTSEENRAKRDEFHLQLINRLEQNQLYSAENSKIDFLDETLFKANLFFPKNISRGVYTVEIYLINEGGLVSFQSIPIYVNQVGLSASILDFAYQRSFLYGLLSVLLALLVGWLTNYLFTRFVGK